MNQHDRSRQTFATDKAREIAETWASTTWTAPSNLEQFQMGLDVARCQR